METSSGLNVHNAASDYNSRQFVSSLVSAISSTPIGLQSANPLREVSPEARNIFLTLYALFEKELLPALDLLDRGLVTRLKTANELPDRDDLGRCTSTLLLVRSAQQHNTRNQAYEHVNYYEVRLDAWSCSCPAFTFSAFPASKQSSEPPSSQSTSTANETGCLIGGLSRGIDIPMCKHLLAGVLVERCEMFAHFIDEREVSVEEIAGWAAGWGD